MTDTMLNNGDTATDVTVQAGDTMEIFAGAAATGTIVDGGGNQFVYDGSAAGTTVAGGEQDVYGGTATGTAVTAGGTQDVFAGTVTGTVLADGGSQYVMGGTVDGTTIAGGGYQQVEGTVTGTTIQAGGTQDVDGTASGTAVASGGTQTVDLGGTGVDTTVASGGTVADNGTLVFDGSGPTLEAGTITGAGNVVMQGPGTLVLEGANSYSGGTVIDSGTVELAGPGAAGTGDIAFAGPATLKIDAAAVRPDGTLGTAIDGFGAGDALDVSALFGSTGPTSATLDGNVLEVSNGGKTVDLTFNNAGASQFNASVDSAGHLVVTAACYRAGTLIATERGAVPIETIAVGEQVLLADGGGAPALWLGHRTIACGRHPRPPEVWPYRIEAGAFGPGRPGRDLFLSPGHAVAVTVEGEEVLVRVEALANGATIRQVPVDTVTYWHVELPRHALILAEGLTSESYLDTGNRASFENGDAPTTLHADFAPGTGGPFGTEHYCRPYVADGPTLALARRLVARRAEALGWCLTPVEAELTLDVDGRTIAPVIDGRWARFRVPEGARAVALVSSNFVPHDTSPGRADRRRLGVMVSEVVVDAADGRRHRIALDHPAFGPGFHDLQETAAGPYRWTDGRADLAGALRAELANGPAGPLTLHLKCALKQGQGWRRRAAA